MDINRTSGQRDSASQRDFITAQSNQTPIREPRKLLTAIAFGLLLNVPVLAQAQVNNAAVKRVVQYRFNSIDVPGATRTAADGNSTHEISGDFDDEDGNTFGFVLNKGVFTKIAAPGADGGTMINGINESGQLAGTFVVGLTSHAFFQNKGYFTTLDPLGSIRTQGGFINAQGQVVGTYRDANSKRHGFIWRKGTFTKFNVPGDDPILGTVAFGINDIGEVVGDYVNKIDQNRHGFLRTRKGDFTTFDVPGAGLTIGEGINNAGTIVGVYVSAADGTLHGFVSNNGERIICDQHNERGPESDHQALGFTTVDFPPDSSGKKNTAIYSINAKGEIVGAYSDLDDTMLAHSHGFLGIPVR
jgi:probable HAF family extracellular repeat protein